MRRELTDTTTSEVVKLLDELRDEGGAVALGRVLTLLVHTQLGIEEEAIAAANEASREHPMRVVVVSRNRDDVRADEEGRLDAEIRVGGDAGASEVVVLRCYGEIGSQLEGIVQGLLLPDAPIVAWWPTFMPSDPGHAQLGQIAHRRITDAAAQKDGCDALLRLADAYRNGDTDLSWTRLTNWRAHLAAMLDQPPFEPVTGAIVRGDSDSPSVHLMAAWLRTRLHVDATIEHPGDVPLGSSGLSQIILTRPSGENSIKRTEESVGLLQQTGQPDHEVALSRRGLRDQLNEELRRLDADDMYREVLEEYARTQERAS